MDQPLSSATESAAPSRGRGRRRSPFWDLKASALTPSEGWVTVALLLAMNLVVTFTVQNSGWVTPAPRLWLVAILALFLGLGLAKAQGPLLLRIVLHLAFLALGLGVSLTETASTLNGSPAAKFNEMFTRLDVWLSAVAGQGISNDRLPFVFLLVASTWLIMYLSTWFTFRLRWAWVAIIPPAIALMTNETYQSSSHYVAALLFFLLFAILLMARMCFLHRSMFWRVHQLLQRTGRHAYLANALVLTFAVLVVAWAVPTQRLTVGPLKDTYRTARAPWADLEDDFERVFAGIPSRKSSPLHSFGQALPLRGRVSLGQKEVFEVTTDFPSYWRAQSYDFYQGRGWIAHEKQRESFDAEDVPGAYQDAGYKKREIVAQKVNLKTQAPVIFAGGQPVEVSVPTEVEIAIPRIYEIDLREQPRAGELPADLYEAATKVADSRGSLAEIAQFIPSETKIVRERRGTIFVTREPPAVPDVLSVRSTKRLKADSSYEVLSSVSVATETDLRSDSTTYPKWVTDTYLQLPADLPERVTQLALELTAGLSNPYEKGLAVAEYLRGLTETYNIEPPPLNVDAVDYFLFSQLAGYSDYFASATAVLLRVAGVPARLATGYASGEFDKETSSFTVRLSDAHSWPEVYFPSYGWIAFEPSPSMQPIPRGPLGEPSAIDVTNPEDDTDDLLGELLFEDEDLLLDDLFPEQAPPITDFVSSIGIKIGLGLASLAGAILALLLLFAAFWQVNFIGLPYGPGMYSRMTKLGALIWREPRRNETPMEYATSLSATAALGQDRAEVIARGFVKSRYSGQPPSPDERREIEKAWRGVRKSLIRRLLWRFNPREIFSRG